MLKGFDKDILRNRIIETRERRGLNQAKLAEKTGITPAAISQIENGLRTPTIPVLQRIANVLEVSIDYLTGKTNEPELRDMLQHEDFKTFFRGYRSLTPEDQKTVSKLVDFLQHKEK